MKKPVDYTIHEQPLAVVDNAKYLGLNIIKNLLRLINRNYNKKMNLLLTCYCSVSHLPFYQKL